LFPLCSNLLGMSRDGAMTLTDVRQPTLELVCEQCGRRGRYSVVRLMQTHGDAKLPELAAQIADCAKARTASIYDSARFAGLPGSEAGEPAGQLRGIPN
jgi:hypothetical protein